MGEHIRQCAPKSNHGVTYKLLVAYSGSGPRSSPAQLSCAGRVRTQKIPGEARNRRTDSDSRITAREFRDGIPGSFATPSTSNLQLHGSVWEDTKFEVRQCAVTLRHAAKGRRLAAFEVMPAFAGSPLSQRHSGPIISLLVLSGLSFLAQNCSINRPRDLDRL